MPEAEYFLLLPPLPPPAPPAPAPPLLPRVPEADDVAADGRRGAGPPATGEAIAAGDGDRRVAGGVRRLRRRGCDADEASDRADSDNRDLSFFYLCFGGWDADGDDPKTRAWLIRKTTRCHGKICS